MILSTESLTLRYGETLAVDAATLEAHGGEVTALLGPNGSGKSSLVRAVAGLVRHEGRILFDGATARPERIGYMPQDIAGRSALTVLEAVLLGRLKTLALRVSPDDLGAVSTLLSDLGLTALARRTLGELSGGQRQMVWLAQALASEPRLLMLDEPISALDMRHQLEVLALIRSVTRQRGLTTICVLHDLAAAARFADSVALMRAGRIVAQGRPSDVITAKAVAAVFDVEAEVRAMSGGRLSVTPLRPVGATTDLWA